MSVEINQKQKCMKSIKVLAICVAFGLFAAPIQAQFFKKLKKKAEQAAEATILNRAQSIAAKQTEKAMDKVFEMQFGKEGYSGVAEKVDANELPEKYGFEWRYKMKFETAQSKEQMDVTYFLKKDQPYWGAQFYQGMDMFMVFDNELSLIAMFVETEGEKFVTISKTPEEIAEDEKNGTMDYSDFKTTELPGKQILGYYCKGVTMENDKMKLTMYITFETEVSFSDVYGKNDQMPKNFDINWLKEGDNEGIVMEMIMEDKKKKKNNMKMRCVTLEKSPYSIKKSDYESL